MAVRLDHNPAWCELPLVCSRSTDDPSRSWFAFRFPAAVAEARQVGFPLVVDHALLRETLAAQLGEEPDGSALVWGTRGGCRSLVLRDLRVGPAAGRLRVTAQGTARLGFGLLGFCFAP